MNERGDLLAARGHPCDGTVRSVWQFHRPTGWVDITAVAEPVGDFEGGVAQGPRQPLAHARRLRSQLDDELARFRPAQPRPHDSADDAHRNRDGDGTDDRLERRHARACRDHPAQPNKTRESRDRRREKQWPLRAACRTAQDARPLPDEEEHSESETNARELPRAVDGVGDTRLRRDRKCIACVWRHQRADELPANRHCVRADDNDTGDA